MCTVDGEDIGQKACFVYLESVLTEYSGHSRLTAGRWTA
jgi:hypothetical protein